MKVSDCKNIDKSIKVMHIDDMANRSIDKDNKNIKRVTVSFPQDYYFYLEKMAQEKKVSLSWVVRDAVETYMEKSNNDK